MDPNSTELVHWSEGLVPVHSPAERRLFSFVIVLKADCHADGRVALRPNFDAALATRPIGTTSPPIGAETA